MFSSNERLKCDIRIENKSKNRSKKHTRIKVIFLKLWLKPYKQARGHPEINVMNILTFFTNTMPNKRHFFRINPKIYRNNSTLTYSCQHNHRKKKWISVVPLKKILISHGRREERFGPPFSIIFGDIVFVQNFSSCLVYFIYFSYLWIAFNSLEDKSAKQNVHWKQRKSNQENFCAVWNNHYYEISVIREYNSCTTLADNM